MRYIAIISLLGLWTLPLGAFAQDAATSAEQKQLDRIKAQKAKEAAELRIEEDMMTMSSLVEALSKNLGQMHYLRTLCFGAGDQKWRDFATQMMDIEAPNERARKRQLIRAFNTGYYQAESRHKTCSQSVSVDAAALAENGRHIASMLGDPYRER